LPRGRIIDFDNRTATTENQEKPAEQESDDERCESAPSHEPHTVARVTTDSNCELGAFDGTYREKVITRVGDLHTAV
jgi:hypothetical protein